VSIRVARENLWAELDKNRKWFFLVKDALELRFMGILKGLLQFNPVLGASSAVYRENASKLLEICEGNVQEVHAVSDIYEVIDAIKEYLTSSEDRYYQRERFFLMMDEVVTALKKPGNESQSEDARALPTAIRHEEVRIQFFTSEIRDYYLHLRVALATTETLLSRAGFTPISEGGKSAICSEAINRFIELRDHAVNEYRTQGNPMADVIIKAAPLEKHHF